MTREETKKAIEVMQHYVDGGDIEILNSIKGFYVDVKEPSWDFMSFGYRKKEEKKYWNCPQDVVIGAVYRLKHCSTIIYPNFFGEHSFMISDSEYCWHEIPKFEYSTDGKTWQECLK